jgi:hypothetical protein
MSKVNALTSDAPLGRRTVLHSSAVVALLLLAQPTKRGHHMATPTVTAVLDKSSYAVGETMTLTVTAADADQKTGSISVVVTDAEGNSSAPASAPYLIDPLTVTVTDPNKTWTKTGQVGNVSTYTATA